jgi:transposase-like protein
MKPGRDPLSLVALQARFADEEKCLALLERARWPAGPTCPHCGVTGHASRLKARPGQFACLDCGKSFSVTSGTPMHKTHLPASIWIIASYLIATSSTTSSKGLSSLKLAGLLGLQYRTTWHLAHRIRAMMDSHPAPLRGIVELDETSMGGKPRGTNRPETPAPVPLFADPQPAPERKPSKRRKAGRLPLKTVFA